MEYEGIVYRPPSEANSLIIQTTIGCPHNRCTFCNMYREKRFRIRKVAEIKKDLDWVANYYPIEAVESIFLADGNSILMKTPQLIEVLEYAGKLFPRLNRITCYGASQYLILKSLEDMTALRKAGLSRIHCGMESGYDPLLKIVKKGGSYDTHIKGGRLVKEAGMELSMYYMPGLGGPEMSREHALASAEVLNAVNPDFIRLRTFIPILGTQMADDYQNGKFQLMQPLEVLEEIKILITNLETESWFLSDHMNNFANIRGKLPDDKQLMLTHLNEALKMPNSAFRPVGMTSGTL